MKSKSRALYFYVGFVLLYIALNLLVAPNKAVLTQYHISSLAARILSSSVVLPLVVIWYAAFYGFAKLTNYAQMIKKNKDGRHVASIARGVTLVALWFPIGSNLTGLMNLWAEHHPGFMTADGIIGGYVTLLIPLIGFLYIGRGARGLVDTIKLRPSRFATQMLVLLLATIGVVYCYFIFTNDHTRTIYHLPIWVLVFTVVIPYLFMWFTGMLAAAELLLYARKSPGIIYRRSWGRLAAGVIGVIVTSISLQYLTTLTNRLSHLKIGAILLLIYFLLILLAYSYVMIALGAKKLQKIEEV